ncbi:MAG: FUSC family protein [Candidatus Dormiibacterota bacterium]
MTLVRRLLASDAGFSALRRALRAAIVMPALFAITDLLLRNPTLASFAAFGSLATLLFVDFGGAMRDRLIAQTALILAQLALITIGTFASQALWVAVLVALAIGFAVLFAGVVSSVLASATTALLLAFVLPVTLPGTAGSLPLRLLGWLFAGALSLIAVRVLWPAPVREPLRHSTAQVCALLARRLRAEVGSVRGGHEASQLAVRDQLVIDARASVAALRKAFFETPYRPTGLATGSRAGVRIVDEVMWLDTVLERAEVDRESDPADGAVSAVKLAAADLLEQGAGVLDAGSGDPARLEPLLRRLGEARDEMEQAATSLLPVRHAVRQEPDSEEEVAEFLTSLEPSFRAQEMTFAVSEIAANIEIAAAAGSRSWLQQLLGRQPGGTGSALGSARDRLGSHLRLRSVWLHNSLRGSIAIALAVLVAESVGAQHSFWVVFGTLAVLRSSALNTGQSALRAVVGTVVGLIVGGGLVYLIGTHAIVYWVLLPFAVLFAGMAPAAISFAAGQAAFTVVLLLLYNVIAPVGWKVGLVRLEDVGIGVAVSLVVGIVFWPRGAGSALGRVLADALTDSVHYLGGAVDFGVTRCDRMGIQARPPGDEQRRAAAAARRLDDAFREFLAERGAKSVPLAEVATLVTAVAALRLTADAIVDLWQREDGRPAGDRTAARNQIRTSGDEITAWYETTARALSGAAAVPDPVPRDPAADLQLIDAVRHDLAGQHGRGTATAVKMIWTADHLDAVRRLQALMLGAAQAMATQARRRRARAGRAAAAPSAR